MDLFKGNCTSTVLGELYCCCTSTVWNKYSCGKFATAFFSFHPRLVFFWHEFEALVGPLRVGRGLLINIVAYSTQHRHENGGPEN